MLLESLTSFRALPGAADVHGRLRGELLHREPRVHDGGTPPRTHVLLRDRQVQRRGQRQGERGQHGHRGRSRRSGDDVQLSGQLVKSDSAVSTALSRSLILQEHHEVNSLKSYIKTVSGIGLA